MITLKVSTFFFESYNVLTLIFFCIISWSRPVIVAVMNNPPMICLMKKPGLFTSVLKILVNPLAFNSWSVEPTE